MAAPPDKLAPFFSASSTDQSAVLVTVAIVAGAVSALAIAAKLFWRRNIFSLKSYDHALLAGATLLFVYTGLVVFSANLGVGKHREAVGEANLEAIRKTQYAIDLLGILIGTCTKVSMCLFIKSINSYNNVFTANMVLLGLICALALSSFLANCFRCKLPTPWLADSAASCPAASSIYQYTIVSSMITDTLIVTLAIAMICKVQTAVKTKVFVISLFSFRMVCVATMIPALLDTTHLYHGQGNSDYTWLSLSPSVWLAATVNCSVITACVPSLKGLFDSWLGNTIGLEIDAPYQLERMNGKNVFEATAYESGHGGGSGGSGGLNSKNSSNSDGGVSSRNQRPGALTRKSSKLGRSPSPSPDRRASHYSALKLGPAVPNQATCFSDGNSGPRGRSVAAGGSGSRRHYPDPNRISDDDDDEDDAHESESVKRLTRGIVIQDEVEVRFENEKHGQSQHSREESNASDSRRAWSAST